MAKDMWKRAVSPPMEVMVRKTLSPSLVASMNSVGPEAWEATLMRRWGTSPFTGKANWADGSPQVSEPLLVLDYS